MSSDSNQEKDYKKIVKAVEEAKSSQSDWTILFVEIVLISITVGAMSPSWMGSPWSWGIFWSVAGAVFVALIVAMNIRPLAWLLIILISLMWGGIGFSIGNMFESLATSIALGTIGFLIGLAIHLSALDWVRTE